MSEIPKTVMCSQHGEQELVCTHPRLQHWFCKGCVEQQQKANADVKVLTTTTNISEMEIYLSRQLDAAAEALRERDERVSDLKKDVAELISEKANLVSKLGLAEDELEVTEHRLSHLLEYATGARYSSPDYSLSEMRKMVGTHLEALQMSWENDQEICISMWREELDAVKSENDQLRRDLAKAKTLEAFYTPNGFPVASTEGEVCD